MSLDVLSEATLPVHAVICQVYVLVVCLVVTDDRKTNAARR